MFRILVLILALFPVSVMAQQLLRGDEPEWALPVELPQASADLVAQSTGGVAFLLADDHLHWNGDVQLAFYRVASTVTDRAGLEMAASINQDFDPTSETLTLTRLQVRRGDRVIDLKAQVVPDIFRRERNLDAGIIDGSLTAHLTVPDLRVGDTVDYSFVLERRPLVPGDTLGGVRSLEFSVPVALTRVVVDWPQGKPLYVSPMPDRVDYHLRYVGDIAQHEWLRRDHVPPPEETDTAVGHSTEAVMQFSGFADWGPLSAALSPYYAKDYPLTPEWEAKVAVIKAAYPDDGARAIAALRLVQNEIRYVGLLVGAGGYYARLPQQVIAEGFGDCKGKSLLLRVILHRLGIEAVPALTDIDNGALLRGDLPRLGAFDHMILRATVAGKTYWMDGTGSHEGGTLVTAVTPDYGFALPLTGADQRALEPIITGRESLWSNSTKEAFNFTLAGVFLDVTSRYGGAAANYRRYEYASRPLAEIDQGFVAFYTGRYPGIQPIRPIRIADDLVANVLETHELYMIPAPAMLEGELQKNFVFAAENFAYSLPKVQVGPRQTALDIGIRHISSHEVTIENAPILFTPPDNVRLENPGFTYSFQGKSWGPGRMQMNWAFETRQKVVQPADVAAVIRDARIVGNTTSYSWDLRQSMPENVQSAP
ncbi:MAG: DUF3857 domain-containing protein [Paracoccaceae bacterium]